MNKVLDSDGTINALGGHYVMAFNIQDANTNVEYDYVTYIIDKIHEEIIAAQKGQLENSRFPHYSMIMYLIMLKNVDVFDQIFFESTEEWGEILLVQRWTRLWKKFIQMSFLFIMILSILH